MKRKVVLAGATGFIGRWIIEVFQNDFQIIALSRKKVKINHNQNIHWKEVDLYSMSSTERALEGADIAIYLFTPLRLSLRLNKGKFRKTNHLLAANFTGAAHKNIPKQIIN